MSELLLGEVDDEGLCLSTVSISMCATPATTSRRCRYRRGRLHVAAAQLVDDGAVHLETEERGF